MRFDLQSLTLFLAALEEKNITKAAMREHIAVSAASKRIQALEDHLGVRLLHRRAHGVEPTDAGRAFARRAEGLFAVIASIQQEMSQYAAGKAGEVVVHANGSAIAECLASDVGTFLIGHPDIAVRLTEQVSDEVLKAVAQGIADIGVFAEPARMPGNVRVRPYREDVLLALVPDGHILAECTKISFGELLDHPLICTDEATSLTRLLRANARSAGRSLNIAYDVRTNEVARWMVNSGLGIVVLPEGFVTPYLGILRVKALPLTDPWARRRLSLAVRDAETLSASAARLLAWLERDHPTADAAMPAAGSALLEAGL